MHRLVVRALGFDIQVPLFVMFRALGVVTDKEILSMIVYSRDEPKVQKKLIDLLRNTILDSHPIFTQQDALRLLALNTKGKDIINVIDVLNHNLFPHYQTSFEKTYLAYVVRQLLLTHLGILKAIVISIL